MSNSVFPTLPGMDAEPEIQSDARTTTWKTVSGRRQSISWGSPTRGYRVRFNVLREGVKAPNESGSGGQDWSSYSEAAVVDKFWTDHRNFDSFLFNAPEVGGVSQKRVMFIEGSFRLQRLSEGLWASEFRLEVVT